MNKKKKGKGNEFDQTEEDDEDDEDVSVARKQRIDGCQENENDGRW